MKSPLPEAAAKILAAIETDRMESEDAARSATLRINNFGAGADPLVIERLNETRQRYAARQGQLAQLTRTYLKIV